MPPEPPLPVTLPSLRQSRFLCFVQVDIDRFALDLQALFAKVEEIQPDLIVAAAQGPDGPAYAAQLAVDDRQINGLVLELVRLLSRVRAL